MAVYEYECEQCTYQMSVTMSIKKFDPKEKRYCPNCGTEIKRKISPLIKSHDAILIDNSNSFKFTCNQINAILS